MQCLVKLFLSGKIEQKKLNLKLEEIVNNIYYT